MRQVRRKQEKMDSVLPQQTLVIGAASSGKSAFAEWLVAGTGRARRYIATAWTGDEEMRARVERHKERRGDDWTTVEAPLEAACAVMDARPEEIVLLDCATLWLSNHLLSGGDPERETDHLLKALNSGPAPVVTVSNEVGAGIVPDDALSRRFRETQGRLNQKLAAAAGLAVTVVAGLPLVLKGRLPEGMK